MTARIYLRSDNYLDTHEKEMVQLEVCKEGVEIMVAKMRHLVFMARGLDPRAANILKQEMLAVDGEAAIPYHAISDLDRPTDCLISGTQRQFQIAIGKLAVQPFGLREVAEGLALAIKNLDRPREKPRIMGILNVTPDSFSDGGQFMEANAAIAHAKAMAEAGADFIDIGGESTRSGAEPVSPEEQLARVLPVIENLDLRVPVSIDSRSPEVILAAIGAGAAMANIVGGLTPELAEGLASSDVPIVVMHMQGQPENMQVSPSYQDVMDEIADWFRAQIALAEEAGIGSQRLIIDPGIGFGKTLENNLEILRRLGELRILGLPVMVGVSRKSFIGKVLDADPDKRMEGSLAAAVLAAENGADILRVHDVAETRKSIEIAWAISFG